MAIRPLANAVLLGGLLGGALDLLYAVCFAAFNGVEPLRLFQTVASGLLGNDAYAGGLATGALGIVCHFSLSLAWAAAFAAVAARSPVLARRRVAASFVFGSIVLLCMRLIVLPLSAYPRPVNFAPVPTALDLTSHVFLFALPIVIVVARVIGARNTGEATPRSASVAGPARPGH